MGQPEFKDEKVVTVRNSQFEAMAAGLTPVLKRWTRTPVAVIKFEDDETQYVKVRPVKISNAAEELSSQAWGKGSDFVLDFGIHMVGFISFKLLSVGSHMDAPCRLRLTFGESPFDVTLGMENVQTWLSSSWLPDEVINVDECPADIRLPRRYSFRYLRVEVIDTSPKYKVAFSEVSCECVSTVGEQDRIQQVRFADPLLQDIDHVSISTLRDCMQTVFEDGPRRDRRLWVGDLRLQALANYCTFKDYALVKRCLYMFAAFPRENGSLPACVFEKPTMEPSSDYIVDYDALFAACVCDYVEASGDTAAGLELWDTVQSCLKLALSCIDPETSTFDVSRTSEWKFLDWKEELDRNAGLHGVLIYCLKKVDRLARILGKPEFHADTIAKLSSAATQFLSGTGEEMVFVSGSEKQISYASASWLVLSEALPIETARAALVNTLAHPNVIRPLTPYLWHHVCDALATVGCYEQCLTVIKEYWGGMVNAGADTFWECFNPEDAKASPYGDVRNNSFCHAWSCTPTLLLRGCLRDYAGVIEEKEVAIADLDALWVKRSESSYKIGGTAPA
ncbi:alpha-L-rhamnosidase [Xylariales sp. PMI_506]|nr:alpha-L-rhamnosidase [Xylariales sp. PMI_506]